MSGRAAAMLICTLIGMAVLLAIAGRGDRSEGSAEPSVATVYDSPREERIEVVDDCAVDAAMARVAKSE